VAMGQDVTHQIKIGLHGVWMESIEECEV
jgi:hypothetical protein